MGRKPVHTFDHARDPCEGSMRGIHTEGGGFDGVRGPERTVGSGSDRRGDGGGDAPENKQTTLLDSNPVIRTNQAAGFDPRIRIPRSAHTKQAPGFESRDPHVAPRRCPNRPLGSGASAVWARTGGARETATVDLSFAEGGEAPSECDLPNWVRSVLQDDKVPHPRRRGAVPSEAPSPGSESRMSWAKVWRRRKEGGR